MNMEYNDSVIQKYNKFLVDNYLIFLPPVINGNSRYSVSDIKSEFDVDGYFRIRYVVQDLRNGRETRAGIALSYDLVVDAYNRWYQPKI